MMWGARPQREHWEYWSGWIITSLALALLASLFWHVLGLKSTGLIEDWTWYERFDQGMGNLVVQNNRPLLLLVYAIGHWLTPNSFVGLNLVGIALFMGKGLLAYGVVDRLRPKDPFLASSVALLLSVFPADTGIFHSRYFSYHMAIVAFLLALYCLLLTRDHLRWWSVLGMWLGLAVSLLTYETAYPLALAAPLLLTWHDRNRRSRALALTLLWYLIPVLLIGFTIIELRTHSTYQAGLLSSVVTESRLRQIVGPFYSLAIAYLRSFVLAWGDALWHMLSGSTQFLDGQSLRHLALSIESVLALVMYWLVPTHGTKKATSPSLSLRPLFIVGLVALGLGFAPYAIIPGQRPLTDRVYLFASLGGALSLGVLIVASGQIVEEWFSRHLSDRLGPVLNRWTMWALLSGFMMIGVMGNLYYAHMVHYYALREQWFLGQIAQQAPKLYHPAQTALIIFDPTYQLAGGSLAWWLFGTSTTSDHMADAVRYLYHDHRMHIQICYPQAPQSTPTRETCHLTAEGVLLGTTPERIQMYPYSSLIAFEYQTPNQLTLLQHWPHAYDSRARSSVQQLYHPLSLIDVTALPPTRVHSLLDSWPPHAPNPQLAVRTSVTIRIGQRSLLNVRLPVPRDIYDSLLGYGWSGTWISAPTATIMLHLAPHRSYQIRFHIQATTNQALLSTLSLSVNSVATPLLMASDPAGGWLYTATVPPSTIDKDTQHTLIAFHLDGLLTPISQVASRAVQPPGFLLGWMDTQYLGVSVEWMDISPIAGHRNA